MPASRKRQKRPWPIKVYANDEQRAAIAKKAARLGLTPARYLLMAGLERPDPM